MMGVMEFCEKYSDLEELADEMRKYAANRIPDIPMSTFNKLFEICVDENAFHLADMEKLDKNSTKKLLKRFYEISDWMD